MPYFGGLGGVPPSPLPAAVGRVAGQTAVRPG